jgi:hypothetical protein
MTAVFFLVLLVTGLVHTFQVAEGNGNPVLVSIVFLGPLLIVAGFAAWACWIAYANEPVFWRMRRPKGR